MKELVEIVKKDILKEDFSRKELVIFGIVAPLAMTLLMGFIGWLDSQMY
jgi:hypothetical protein